MTYSVPAGAARRGSREATRLLAVVLVAASLSACVNDTGPKQQIGTLLGGAGGAFLGSKIGKGRGQLAGVAAGALLGAFLGNEAGRSLDRADRAAISQAQSSAQHAPINETISWRNPDSGNYGSITPVREGQTSSGAYCREFQQTITVGGKTEQGYGTACRQPDGSWQIANN